jgi:hypothetical protein
MSLGIIGIDPTRVTTNQEFALGVRGAVEDQSTGSGTKEYMYVSFAASTARAIGDLVLVSSAGAATGATSTNAAAGQAAGRRAGVVVATIASVASVQYGWVQVYGVGAVAALTLCVLNTPLYTTATAGAVDDTATVLVNGIVLNSTVGGSTAVTPCTLNYPFLG